MASKKTLNASNLETLGATRLAELLIEIAEGNAATKRRLRLELAGAESPGELAKAIHKRLVTIGRSRGFVDWRGLKPLIADLEAQRRAITDDVAKRTPAEGLDLMWRFVDLATSVFGRTDDGSGSIAVLFHMAIEDLGRIAASAKPDPERLADQVYNALLRNEYGQFDGIIRALQVPLGAIGLEHLKQRMISLSAEPVQTPDAVYRKVMGWSSVSGPIYADDMAQRARESQIRQALQDIADAQGDVDAFVVQYDEKQRKVPKVAASIAQRLLAANRVEDAWQIIAAAGPRSGWLDVEFEDARIEVLDALGRGDDAQAARWACFERSLSAGHLRDLLKRLPDFEDFDAEQRALDYVVGYSSALQALSFLVAWPALDRAARLVLERVKELDGNHYEVLTPAADALAGRYPLAATLVLRAMIEFALNQARFSRYGHAARHLRDCEGLATSISDFGTFEPHEAYLSRLRADHGRKTGFWTLGS